MKIYDISVPLGDATPVYEGDPPIEIIPKKIIANGDSANISLLSMGVHSGTHIDAPYHFDPSGKRIDELAVDTFIGAAQVIEAAGVGQLVTREALANTVAPDTTRLLIKTPNSALWEKSGFDRDFISLSLEAAEFVVENNIRLVGVDYLSVEKFHSPDHAVHKMLLENSVIALEGLNLTGVPPGTYQLIALPLKIAGGDGSPTRAILISN